MDETFLLTVAGCGQAGNDLLIFPTLPADKYQFTDLERLKIVKPDNLVIEKDAEFSIPFDAGYVYLLLIPNTQKDEVLLALKFGSRNL
jgi:hypothetical protein